MLAVKNCYVSLTKVPKIVFCFVSTLKKDGNGFEEQKNCTESYYFTKMVLLFILKIDQKNGSAFRKLNHKLKWLLCRKRSFERPLKKTFISLAIRIYKGF